MLTMETIRKVRLAVLNKGMGKGQVERQVQSFRGRFFTQRQSFSSHDDFNLQSRKNIPMNHVIA